MATQSTNSPSPSTTRLVWWKNSRLMTKSTRRKSWTTSRRHSNTPPTCSMRSLTRARKSRKVGRGLVEARMLLDGAPVSAKR